MVKNLQNITMLRWVFILSGIYDIILGTGLLIFFNLLLDIFKLSKPNNMIFVYASGLFLLFIGYIFLYASQDPSKFTFIGFGMVLVRLSYASIILWQGVTIGIEGVYLITGFTDFLMALVLLIPLLLTEEVKYKE